MNSYYLEIGDIWIAVKNKTVKVMPLGLNRFGGFLWNGVKGKFLSKDFGRCAEKNGFIWNDASTHR